MKFLSLYFESFIIYAFRLFQRKQFNKQLRSIDTRELATPQSCAACGEGRLEKIAPGTYDCLTCDFVGGPGYRLYSIKTRLDSLDSLSPRKRRALASEELSLVRVQVLKMLPRVKSARVNVFLSSLGGPFGQKFDSAEVAVVIEQVLALQEDLARIASYADSDRLRGFKITEPSSALLQAHVSSDEPDAKPSDLRGPLITVERRLKKLPAFLYTTIHILRS